MPSSVRSKDASGSKAPLVQAPMSERQQMALLMQMTSSAENLPKSPGGTSYSRQRDRNERGETPLHLAAIKGDVEQVSKLLSHRADPNAADFAGWTPLHEACNHGWYEIALKLVEAGATVNSKGLDNDTPLHDATVNGHINLVKLLVQNGADIHAKNARGNSPLDVASPSVKPYLLNPSLPVSESTTSTTRLPPRTRDEKKLNENNKQKAGSDENMENNKTDDVYEFKSSKDTSPEHKTVTENEANPDNASSSGTTTEDNKRNFSEANEGLEDGNDDESKKKKRKEETPKDKSSLRISTQNKSQCNKQNNASQSKNANLVKLGATEKKSPCPSPKMSSDVEDDSKSDLKVPPLKIVIPQTASGEQEAGANRNSKNNNPRTHQALPYVVPSSSSESSEKDSVTGNSTEDASTKVEEKKDSTPNSSEEQRTAAGNSNQRVLRSSHKAGASQCQEATPSNNSSPPLLPQRSHSPSPLASPTASVATPPADVSIPSNCSSSNAQCKTSSQSQPNPEAEATTSSASTVTTVASTPNPVELHPRKRKMKQSKEAAAPATDGVETPADPQVHPHDQPITNCYQLYLDIRKQIERRRKGLFPVQPKPPHGFKDYLMNRCTYVLAGTTPTTPSNISYPATLAAQLKDVFTEQEHERYRLRMQHVVEKEKLVLSVEQEIFRVHGRAARALANQSLPFSVCSILRDEEVYNLITPEQEEKDRNARSRYNGRLFLSWLQDVDDKWEKIKEHMLLRHHNEAESLHAVQKMNWEWKMKELSLCDNNSTPKIDELHVPIVHVSDDFDLPP